MGETIDDRLPEDIRPRPRFTPDLSFIGGFWGDKTTREDMVEKGYVPVGERVYIDRKVGLPEDRRPSGIKGRDIARPAIRVLRGVNPTLNFDAILAYVEGGNPSGYYLQAYQKK